MPRDSGYLAAMRPKLLIGSMIDRQPINNGSRLHFWGMTNGISDVADSTYVLCMCGHMRQRRYL